MDTLTRFKNAAVLSPLFLASLPTPVSTDLRAPFVVETGPFEGGQFTPSQRIVPTLSNRVEENIHVVSFNRRPTNWTKQMGKRFDELARLEAFGKITPPQLSELEMLASDRRNLQYPRTAEEILWEYNQRRLTTNMVKAVQEYAKFHECANSERKSPSSKNT